MSEKEPNPVESETSIQTLAELLAAAILRHFGVEIPAITIKCQNSAQ